MYAAERRRQILEKIRVETSVSVADLAACFNVSTSTIRRDLNNLSRADLLERTYGGAVTPLVKAYEAPFGERSASYTEEKYCIGQAAARLVRPGDTIMVDGGTTTVWMSEFLRAIPGLTVVTFGLNILNALAGSEQVTVIGVGGMLHHRSLTFGGVLATDALDTYNLRFDKAFIAAAGISAQGGVTNVSFDEIPLKRKAIEFSREVILLADSSKVGVSGQGFIAPVSRVHRLITGRDASPTEVDALRRLGLTVDLV